MEKASINFHCSLRFHIFILLLLSFRERKLWKLMLWYVCVNEKWCARRCTKNNINETHRVYGLPCDFNCKRTIEREKRTHFLRISFAKFTLKFVINLSIYVKIAIHVKINVGCFASISVCVVAFYDELTLATCAKRKFFFNKMSDKLLISCVQSFSPGETIFLLSMT